MRAVIQGVELPFDLEDFATPNWPRILRHYGDWTQAVHANGAEPMEIQPYMLEFADQLAKFGYCEKLGAREYRSADDILERCFAHFGIAGVDEMFKEGKAKAMAASVATKTEDQRNFRAWHANKSKTKTK